MNFLKKLGVDKSKVTNQVKQVATQAGGVVMQKVFSHFAGGKNAEGKETMDVAQLVNFSKVTGILDNKLGEGDIKNIFNKIKGGISGGGSGGGDAAPAAPAAPAASASASIDYDEFREGMKEMANKKYEDEPGTPDDKLSKLESLIITDADSFLKEK